MAKNKKPRKPRDLNTLWSIIHFKGGAFVNRKLKRAKQKLKKFLNESD
jgi:hypothetical protein